MWLGFALTSALFLGLYDVAKKQSLKENAVIPVLWLHTLFCSLIMLPFTLLSAKTGALDGSIFYVPIGDAHLHRFIFLKAAIVLSSWVFGYFGMKHLPITLFGPINATRPIIVLLGGLLIFGERLNLYQWIGVILAVISFYMLSLSGKKEGISFTHNKWVFCVIMATLLGAVSALFDKYLLQNYNNMFVQAWSNFYQLALMTVILFAMWWPTRKKTTPLQWRWSIILISVFLTMADYAYFYSLTFSDSLISIVSMIRRSSVIISFLCGAMIFREKNLKSKAVDLLVVLLGLAFLLIGSLR